MTTEQGIFIILDKSGQDHVLTLGILTNLIIFIGEEIVRLQFYIFTEIPATLVTAHM